MKEGIPTDRRPPRRGGSQDDGRLLDRHGGHSSGGGPSDAGGPPHGGGSPDDGGPPDGNGRPSRCPDRRGCPGPRGPPGPIRPVVIQQPQVVLDTTLLENTFDNMGQSMLQTSMGTRSNKSSPTATYSAGTPQYASSCWCFASTS